MPELQDSPSLRERIIAESQQYLTGEPEEGEFTIEQYMEWNGIDSNASYRALNRMEDDGKITKRKGKVNGASCSIYKES